MLVVGKKIEKRFRWYRHQDVSRNAKIGLAGSMQSIWFNRQYFKLSHIMKTTSNSLSSILYFYFVLGIALFVFPFSFASAQTVSSVWTFSAWSGGYTANLTIKNTGPTPITNWKATFTTPQEETSVWNATISGPVNNVYMLTPPVGPRRSQPMEAA